MKAPEHLTTAASMHREMDMGFWLEKVAAALDPPHEDGTDAGEARPEAGGVTWLGES